MKAWLQLVKYKLSLAVTITGATLYILHSEHIDGGLVITAFGIFLLSAGASALNQFQEKKYDSLMQRTMDRPLPSGRIKPALAVIASAVMILSGSLLLVSLSTVAATLGLLNIFLYNLLYTYLKRISYLAIIPGALVGAVPPLIGWFAAGAAGLSKEVIFLSSLMFMWQVPHFWILVIKYNEDYTMAGFKSILGVMNQEQVKRLVLVWIMLSLLLAVSFPFFGLDPGAFLTWTIMLLCLVFIIVFLLTIAGKRPIISAFILSNIFIVLFFILLGLGYLN